MSVRPHGHGDRHRAYAAMSGGHERLDLVDHDSIKAAPGTWPITGSTQPGVRSSDSGWTRCARRRCRRRVRPRRGALVAGVRAGADPVVRGGGARDAAHAHAERGVESGDRELDRRQVARRRSARDSWGCRAGPCVLPPRPLAHGRRPRRLGVGPDRGRRRRSSSAVVGFELSELHAPSNEMVKIERDGNGRCPLPGQRAWYIAPSAVPQAMLLRSDGCPCGARTPRKVQRRSAGRHEARSQSSFVSPSMPNCHT